MKIPTALMVLEPLFNDLKRTATVKLDMSQAYAMVYVETENKNDRTLCLKYMAESEVYSAVANKIAGIIYDITNSISKEQVTDES